ncbi:MFS transporter [Actinomadura rudentiformis]|uniref:MFS transporter n=1 Tax=Actinomadura rudentiformis TaxID=359158 RepID=A0A6H9YED8_9ACTN|nr:MFS transporter [Actinomadura rudentiformis]KAB2343701.1 MFS transporter [Actinomadura rudentiformis]
MATGTAPAEAATGGGALRGRDFRLLWAAETVSKTGTAVTTFALPLVALQTLGASTLMMGVLNAMIWLPWLLVGLQAGVWADRRSRRPLMIGCEIASALLIVSVPVLAWLGALTMGYLLVVAFATGCATVLFTAAYNAYLPFLVGKDELMGANSRLMGSEQAANIAGPGLGGLIIQLFSAVLGLVVDAFSFVVSAVCLWSIRAREPSGGPGDRTERTPATFRADIGAAIRFVARDPYLRIITASSTSTNLLMAGIQALVVVFLVRDAGLSPWAVGATTITISVGGILGAFLAPKVTGRLGTARTLLTAPVTDCFLLLFPLAGHGPLLVVALAGTLVWATGIVVRNVTGGAFRQAYCPSEMRARAAMTMRFTFFGIWPIGSLLGGVLGSVLDVRTALFILAGANVITDIWIFIGPIKRSRDLPTEFARSPGESAV